MTHANPSRPLLTFPAEKEESLDRLLSFPEETNIPSEPPLELQPRRHRRLVALLIATALVVVAVIAITGIRLLSRPSKVAAGKDGVGIVAFTSEPAGARVVIDAVDRGLTPVQLAIPAGEHLIVIEVGGVKRSLPLMVRRDSTMAQHFEFALPVAKTGRLEVVTDPPGSRVEIDGAPAGIAPVTVPALGVGQHTLTLSKDRASLARSVTITAGATASVMITMPSAALLGGWLRINSPIELDVYEEGQLLGSNRASRLMLPAGQHELELLNTALEFRSALRLKVEGGKTSFANVSIPAGSISVNAVPWAEVSIDGKSVGTTPIANISVPIGNRQVILRHPQLGEQTRTISVTALTPVRLSVDLTK